MDDTAALLGSSAIKQRLAGVNGLLQQLRREDAAPEVSATLIPSVLPCLRDHNSKIALGALEILELLVSRVAEETLRSYFKLLWLSLVERLGDSKLQVREKAVDVVVQISVVLDVSIVLERLKGCMKHKNWRTREQVEQLEMTEEEKETHGASLHAVWRVLERHELFSEKQEELLNEVLKLLEDSSKDVRDAAITALEKFYTYIGSSLLTDSSGYLHTLSQLLWVLERHHRMMLDRDVPTSNIALPDELSSIMSSYDLQISSSSSSMARYLASVRSRTLNEAKAAAAASGDGDQSPSQASSASSKAVQDISSTASLGSGGSNISEREIQKQLGAIFDKLQLVNNWDKRVDALKMLQKLADRCRKASNSETVLPFLSQALRSIRDRLCQQATYVTIQVISTAADSTIRSMIESTSNGYSRVIPKLIECAKSRNQVLRCNAVCYLTLTLQRWSSSFLSKHSDLFVPILPALLQDALGDQLFPDEAKGIFARLDGSTQKNLKDDPSKFTAGNARQTDYSSMGAPLSQGAEVVRSALQMASEAQPPISAPAALNSVTFSDEQPTVYSSGEPTVEIEESEPTGPKRLPLVSMPSPTESNASSSRTNNSSLGDIKSKATRSVPAKEDAHLPMVNQLEEALRNMESRSWSTRLEAAEYIGNVLQKRVDQIANGASGDHKVDGRILITFIKHLSDAHYRVSQGVLKHFLPLLKLSNDSQRFLPHLKTVLPKLFQKFIDTKESIRVVAKENLEYVASTVDSSTVAALVISMLGDGSNMKVKAAMCHYLRELLPGADGYMKNGTNNSHMRSFLLKIALLMDADVPVSVSAACGELVSVAAQLYGPEMEVALGLLPPSKRLVVSKVLKSKKIVLNFSNPPRPPFSLSSTAPQSARSRDGDDENQAMPERSRKRPESPSDTSSSPVRQSSQKRINTVAQSVVVKDQRADDRTRNVAGVKRAQEVVSKATPSGNAAFSTTLFSSAGSSVDKPGVQLDDILLLLEQNNLPMAEMKGALVKIPVTRDHATEKNVYALKVLQTLVEAQLSRAQLFFELLLQRLTDAIGDQVEVAQHLMERILHDLVRSTSDHQQMLLTLTQQISRTEPPALLVVLHLVMVCLVSCEQSAFLRKPDVAGDLMRVLKRRLDHASSNVRKNTVQCFVTFYFATKEETSIVPKFLASELDGIQRRLVEIFIDRAKMER
uniref:TOG domain-containing protein n=1 Tax=Phytophthora ramorum TaxID=164328 RepID=H3GYE1_PHYRM